MQWTEQTAEPAAQRSFAAALEIARETGCRQFEEGVYGWGTGFA
jgi:hypothetical protein